MSSRDLVIPFPIRTASRSPLKAASRIGARASSTRFSSSYKVEPLVVFHRTELTVILSCYGMMVSKGEWRDYAIDMGKDFAVFSIFRHSSECPLYKLEKHPKLAKKQGAYLLRNDQGRVLKRGHELAQLLKYFDKKLKLVKG